MKGIFHPDNWYDWDTPFPNVEEVKKSDPVEDKYYREYIVQHFLLIVKKRKKEVEKFRKKW